MGVARPSRPPGFDMTYRPPPERFGPPWSAWLPSLAYLGVAVVVGLLVLWAERSSTTSALFVYLIEADARRVLGSRALSAVLLVSAVSAVLRTSLRGVRLRGDGLEVYDVVVGWPRVRRFHWAQIDCIVLDQPTRIALDLWDGTRAWLPPVMDRAALSRALEKVGYMRAIPVRGGLGLDDLPETDDLEE